jgi:hypothetical protein
MERRKKNEGKSTGIPADYVKMVEDIFTSNFDQGLKKLGRLKSAKTHFEVNGAIFVDEVVLAVSLLIGKELAATTVYGSADYDPLASFPQVHDLLAACVDAIGNVFAPLFSGEKKGQLEKVADPLLGALEDVPFEWTPTVLERLKVYVKIDKSNPSLERIADEWLNKNDPNAKERAEEEARETEKLFVTGEQVKAKMSKKPGSGSIH